MSPQSLENRLTIAIGTWREMVDEPLPKIAAGDPAQQVEALELVLVDRLCSDADRASAREVADRTWELVHDRPDDEPVKRRVVECHQALVALLKEE